MHEPAAGANLQAMEGSWSHSVRGWSNLIGTESSCMSSLFFQDSMPGESKPKGWAYGGRFWPDQVLQGGFEAMKADQLETTSRAGLILDSLLRSSSSSMVDSTSEIVTADDQDAGLCSVSNEPINMRNFVMPNGRQTASSGASCLQQLRSDSGARLQFCMAPERPAGFLSRGESEESLGEPFFKANSCAGLGSLTTGLKRRLKGAGEETWMDSRSQTSPTNLMLHEEKPFVFQERSAAYGVPSSLGGSYINPPGPDAIPAAIPGSATQFVPPFAPGATALSHEVEQGDRTSLRNKMASMRAILFRASLPMPTVAEIESSRPKRRNVRISKDPQSVAARHRRERISDRIRVLQRLVPGGTKMDTASMLDEAIHYVKFLKFQLQTLEQLGNGSCDPATIYNGAMGVESTLAAAPVRSFDLNCTVYNQFNSSCESAAAAGAAVPLVVTGPLSSGESPETSRICSGAWPNASSVSRPFGGPGQFPDPLQEQFCH